MSSTKFNTKYLKGNKSYNLMTKNCTSERKIKFDQLVWYDSLTREFARVNPAKIILIFRKYEIYFRSIVKTAINHTLDKLVQ